MTSITLRHDDLPRHESTKRVPGSVSRVFPDRPVHTSLYGPFTCLPEHRNPQVQPGAAV
jgi:hypothetical protein